MTTKTAKWTMPKWMEPYRSCIVNTGGNTVEELVNGNASPIVNLPLSTLQACVKSQVALLNGLHSMGALTHPTQEGHMTVMTHERAAYVLAMAVLQSSLYAHIDDEMKEAIRVATAGGLREGR